MGRIIVDAERHPRVHIRFDGAVDDDAFRRYLSEYSAQTLERGGPYTVLLDARAAGSTPSRQRRAQADWMRDNAVELARLCQGAAFVIDNVAIRGILTAILWIQKIPMPHVVVRSVDEGEAWLDEQMAAAQAQAR